MASIRERTTKAGQTTYSVLFRLHKVQTSETFTSREEAEKFADLIRLVGVAKALALLDGGESEAEPPVTVGELYEQWFAWKRDVEHRVTARTLRDYQRDYDLWIAPRFGRTPAEAVDEIDVQKWVDWMARELDAKTVADRHMLLGQVFKWASARSRRLVEHNPCLETMLPKRVKKPPRGFTLAQWHAIRAYAMEHHPDAADLLRFLAGTGWRWGEATPLRVGSVEDRGDVVVEGCVVPQVWVSVDVVVRRDENDIDVEAVGEAKSRAGIRRINLPPDAAEVVRRRIIGKGPLDYVFTNDQGGRWHANNFNHRLFPKILAGAGVEKAKGMGPHFLRHTSVGIMDRADVSMPQMQRRIGHGSISTTIGVYGGTIDNTLGARELLAMDALLAPRPAPGGRGEVVQGSVVGEASGEHPALGGV